MLDRYIVDWMHEVTEFLLWKVREQTPEDTWELQSNNREQPISNNWIIVKWWLINETSYWPYVEYWVGSKSYNYYKWGWRRKWWKPFYIWVWARMFTKAQFENWNRIREIFIRHINQWIKDFNSQKNK